jgi:hypothetical protein
MAYWDIYPLKILAAGVCPLTADRYINFSEGDLERICTAFNELDPPRPAPVVAYHPEDDAPSYGAVNRLRVVDNMIVGYAENLTNAFRGGLRDGTWQRYAAQFYSPENPSNPVPGSWFLKHVGFRGKVPAIVRGFLNTDAQYMESLEGAGRAIPPELRVGKRGQVEFSEFATAALKIPDLALLGRAYMLESCVRGQEINFAGAIETVYVASVNASNRGAKPATPAPNANGERRPARERVEFQSAGIQKGGYVDF